MVLRHLFSLATSAWVISNLCFWMIFVFVLALFKLLLSWIPACRTVINHGIEGIYRIAAGIDSLWMVKVVGIQFQIEGELPDHPAPIVVVNHQSWFDIPILQHVVTGQGPILKFLIKRNLVWVPIVGWICWALGFPRLNRGTGDGAREKDYAAIESASTTLNEERGAMLIFSEGTRFTRQKHRKQQSPFRHLLLPRPGGLKIALGAVPPDTPIVDVSLAYHGTTNFWRCLGGATRTIDVRFRTFRADEVLDSRDWLMQQWREKDAWIDTRR